MSIYQLNHDGAEDIGQALNLFNGVIASDNLPYKPLGRESFGALFFKSSEGLNKISLGFKTGEKTTGFLNAAHRTGSDTAYITFAAVDPACRRRGIGKFLAEEMKHKLSEYGGITKIDISFFNPIQLEWLIPNTPGHDHNNSPGIDVSTGAYLFFKNMDYRDFACQNSFYMPIESYRYSEDVLAKMENLKARGLEICYYDKNKHSGFEELCDDLGSDDWRGHIFGNLAKEKSGQAPDPMLILAQGERVRGFAGPLRRQESGRGFFAGIGVHSDCRGGGAGTALFSSLCMGLKDLGAGYMTLFTGEKNPARNIYRAAGFKIVKTWANMRLEV